MTDEQLDLIVADYATDRRAVRRWAATLGISVQTIYYAMDRRGVVRRKGGDANKGTQAGPQNPHWKDGTTRRKDGYILQRENGKQEFQHRIVAREKLGRPLSAGEIVHHINGDKSDNRPENLEILSSHAEHMKEHCDSAVMRERGRLGNAARYAALRARQHGEG